MPPFKSRRKVVPFRFLDLPYELRLEIYMIILRADRTIDLGAYNHHMIAPLLQLLLTSRQVHDEAAKVFYGINTFRIFSTDGKFIQTKRPLLSRFPASYRAMLSSLELRLGPGWNKPPKLWGVSPKYGLKDGRSIRLLKVLIELDPEDSPICREWMNGRTSYTDFSVALLVDILSAVPTITEIRFDGFPSVRKYGPLMRALGAASMGRKITYGPIRGWEREEEPESVVSCKDVAFLTDSLSHMLLSDPVV